MTTYWEEPTVRYREEPTVRYGPKLTSATAQTERMQLARMSRTAATPVPAHHRVDRHPTTVVVPPQPSKTKTKTKTKKSENRFFNDVEGLRGIAVALVVLFHAGVPHMAGGFVGVDVFFVISGFLITGLLLREFERNGRVSFRGFYARRARRIIPPAAVTIVATSIAVWFLMPMLSVFRQALDLLAATMNFANWRFIAAGKDYLAGASDDSVATHFWSLSIEEQFYFVWPVLLVALAVLAKRMRWSTRMVVGWGIAVVIVASMLASLHFTASDPTLSYMATHTRAWQFGVGAIVAVAGPLLTGLMTKIGCASGDVGARLGGSGRQCWWRQWPTTTPRPIRAWPRCCRRSVPPRSLWPDRWPPAAGPPSGGFSRRARCGGWARSPTAGICGTGPLWCCSRATPTTTAGRRWWA